MTDRAELDEAIGHLIALEALLDRMEIGHTARPTRLAQVHGRSIDAMKSTLHLMGEREGWWPPDGGPFRPEYAAAIKADLDLEAAERYLSAHLDATLITDADRRQMSDDLNRHVWGTTDGTVPTPEVNALIRYGHENFDRCPSCELALLRRRPCVIDGCRNEIAYHVPGYPDCVDRCEHHHHVVAGSDETFYVLPQIIEDGGSGGVW